jgi:hypothetical protein
MNIVYLTAYVVRLFTFVEKPCLNSNPCGTSQSFPKRQHSCEGTLLCSQLCSVVSISLSCSE